MQKHLHNQAKYPLIAQITRAKAIESQHFGFWAFLSEGNFQAAASKENSLNILDEYVCLRSVAKLFQTLTCLRLGLVLTDRQVAIATSSHSGTNEHIHEVSNFIQHFDLDWHELQCGEHSPIDRETQYYSLGSTNRRLQNNCSGKHSMMLATCKLQNWERKNYYNSNHPLQQAICKTITELCEISLNNINVALDGCGLPTYALPVKNILLGFSKFTVHSHNSHIQQIARALLHHSQLVSGANRFDHELTIACKPQLISKSGAGGITLVSFQKELQTSAFLLKLHDADERLRALVLKYLLIRFGVEAEWQHNLFSNTINNLNAQEAAEIELFI